MFWLPFTVILLRVINIGCSKIDTEHYTIWTIPEGAKDVLTSTQNGVGLIGGGPDCVEAFSWQIQNANQGDFVIIRASGDDGYNDFVYSLSKTLDSELNSVTTILFKDGNASFSEEVQNLIQRAEAIFFAGGDQNRYLQFWTNTPIQSILQQKSADVTISGTSAGLAILGNWVYSATEGSAYSDESLLNPYNKFITIAPALLHLPYLSYLITDTHFGARDRMGRLLSFVARINQDNHYDTISSFAHGIGVDEQTAILLNITTGESTVVGMNNAYICVPQYIPSVCVKDTPLSYLDISCTRLNGLNRDKYDFNTWSPIISITSSSVTYPIDIVNGKYANNTEPYGP